ncbi:MAG: hypothetical protein CBD27_11710 [Rhodospirillaceae bacterium TMED167]|nr:tRNA (N6-threonylcarbamoyladenosine(37)-N6)-methyltransferase TrmO [Rhodospirillaceae bacterium]OUW24045.1 MAG: hypothetical protein CBD27_11710 [Rhodospirillaceae bacterium TMED167]
MVQVSKGGIYLQETEPPAVSDTVACQIIGTIQSPYLRLEECPSRHKDKPHLPCTIRLALDFAPGLVGLKAGGRAFVLYWFHLARRDMVQLPERAGVRDAPVGVFSLRTPPRPNPIAAADVDILAVRNTEIDVLGLDCLNGTPLLDIKNSRT